MTRSVELPFVSAKRKTIPNLYLTALQRSQQNHGNGSISHEAPSHSRLVAAIPRPECRTPLLPASGSPHRFHFHDDLFVSVRTRTDSRRACRPRRWLIIGLLCGLASGIGATVLVELFHHLGWEMVNQRYPDLLDSETLQHVSEWLENYGLIALMIIAGSPMPQTPALLLYSLVNPSPPGVLFAVGIGKTIKYIFLAWATNRYPARFMEYR